MIRLTRIRPRAKEIGPARQRRAKAGLRLFVAGALLEFD